MWFTDKFSAIRIRNFLLIRHWALGALGSQKSWDPEHWILYSVLSVKIRLILAPGSKEINQNHKNIMYFFNIKPLFNGQKYLAHK